LVRLYFNPKQILYRAAVYVGLGLALVPTQINLGLSAEVRGRSLESCLKQNVRDIKGSIDLTIRHIHADPYSVSVDTFFKKGSSEITGYRNSLEITGYGYSVGKTFTINDEGVSAEMHKIFPNYNPIGDSEQLEFEVTYSTKTKSLGNYRRPVYDPNNKGRISIEVKWDAIIVKLILEGDGFREPLNYGYWLDANGDRIKTDTSLLTIKVLAEIACSISRSQ